MKTNPRILLLIAVFSGLLLFILGFGMGYIALRAFYTSGGGVVGPIACTEEARICPDGSAVGRNPMLNCEFDPCPGSSDGGNGQGGTQPGGIVCTLEAKLCPDGSYVSRNSARNCEFDPCGTVGGDGYVGEPEDLPVPAPGE